MKKPSISDLIEKIHENEGNVSGVARCYGRARSTVQSWIDASSTAIEALEDARESRVDKAEEIVYSEMEKGTLQAAFYVLNNHPLAKKRGWGPKVQQEHTGGDGGPLSIVIDK